MLSATDLAGFDLPALVQHLQDAALRQDRCRRQAARLDVPEGFTGTKAALGVMGTDAAAIAEGARFVALVQRLLVDEGHRQPAPVLRLVQPTAKAAPRPVPRPGLYALTMAALGRAPVEVPRRNASGAV